MGVGRSGSSSRVEPMGTHVRGKTFRSRVCALCDFAVARDFPETEICQFPDPTAGLPFTVAAGAENDQVNFVHCHKQRRIRCRIVDTRLVVFAVSEQESTSMSDGEMCDFLPWLRTGNDVISYSTTWNTISNCRDWPS